MGSQFRVQCDKICKLFLVFDTDCLPVTESIGLTPFSNQFIKKINNFLSFPTIYFPKFLKTNPIALPRLHDNKNIPNGIILMQTKLLQKHPQTSHINSLILIGKRLHQWNLSIIFSKNLNILSFALQILLQFVKELSVRQVYGFVLQGQREMFGAKVLEDVLGEVADQR